MVCSIGFGFGLLLDPTRQQRRTRKWKHCRPDHRGSRCSLLELAGAFLCPRSSSISPALRSEILGIVCQFPVFLLSIWMINVRNFAGKDFFFTSFTECMIANDFVNYVCKIVYFTRFFIVSRFNLIELFFFLKCVLDVYVDVFQSQLEQYGGSKMDWRKCQKFKEVFFVWDFFFI